MADSDHLAAALVAINLDIVPDAVSRENAHHAARRQRFLRAQPVQHGVGVGKQTLRLFAYHLIFQNARIFACQRPGHKERRPVDIVTQRVDADRYLADAKTMRRRRRIAFPVDGDRVIARSLQRYRRRARFFTRVLDAHGLVLFPRARHEILFLRRGEQRRHHAHGARGVLHIDRRAAVVLLDLHGGVRLRRGRAANQQRQRKALTLHLFGDVDHLIQRWRNQARQPDNIGLLFDGGFQDLIARHHYAEIDNLVVIALQHHADDIFADVVHVALYRRQHDFAVAAARLFAGLNIGFKVSDRLLHHARRLHHLRQEHLPFAEQVAHHVHTRHQRSFNHLDRPRRRLARLFGVLLDKLGDAFYQRIFQTLNHVPAAPFRLLLVLGAVAFTGAILLRQRQQTLGAVVAAVKDHVLYRIAQLGGEIVVNRQLTGVDDAHIHAVADGVVEEHRVDGFAYRIVAAERERHVRDAAGDHRMRQLALDIFAGTDKVHRVVVMLVDAGGDGKDIRVKDNIFRRKADLFGQDFVGAAADLDFARARIRLPLFIKGHHHHRRAVAAHQPRMVDKDRLALFHRDRVNDAFALDALQPHFNHLPFRGVDHDRHACDIGLAGDQVKEAHHRRFGVEHPLIHIDVDNLRAALHLLQCHFQRLVVLLFFDQTLEFG